MTTTQSPGESARRSRRGYFYQDVATLHACLDMLDGRWDSVTPEGDEDIVCECDSPRERHLCQVKTDERGDIWTSARLCRDDAGRSHTSILGKLLTGKTIDDATRFILIFNQSVAPELRGLIGDARSDSERAYAVERLGRALQGLTPSDGYTLDWCLTRLEIRIDERTIESLENKAFRRLAHACHRRGMSLLPEECEDVLSRILSDVCAEARKKKAKYISRVWFAGRIDELASAAARSVHITQNQERKNLSGKLSDAGFDDQAIAGAIEAHLRFRRRVREATVGIRRQLDDLSDVVHAACMSVTARRRSGALMPGAATFAATYDALQAAPVVAALNEQIGFRDVMGSLHDVTSRCRHRYV